MWKYFVTPRHYLDHPTDDIFPNMLAESGIYKQPQYLADGVPTQGDCPILKTRLWNEKPTGKQDAVEYTERPACITPGKPWSIQIRYHLESIQKADMRTNLMLGTGGDKYLGPNDVFVTENVFTVSDNKGWTAHTVQFTAAQTQLFAKRPSPYVTSFMVPAGSEFNGGWQMVDSEKDLQIKYC
ncbi:hypothetical protein JKP88DRAFT_233810 [Tribonema minus]|uniref:Uncharacterized protein n=1 Tax=Tribonema minus TaxID=303371 RepID=A0A836CMI4_9STRA|nr:hypothetical protein JKP88DRAFT_233810 [Tribonema minus]